ncbi:hypothetical protein MLGJGCBP_07936 [Rhodococcus sp. T7]|uniref:Uncharacterized protein n=1 Tax=Rhodococcus opacus (strain B4) TaxID=632772 RepID=C1BCU6_RHOOB|nr:hypothetical protein MLGJGCBP_07936 [Rhodococcus sp. T7]BAH55690.1 hypothetical protein ROP_pROB01-01910 [Rhodococcus opacus B4]
MRRPPAASDRRRAQSPFRRCIGAVILLSVVGTLIPDNPDRSLEATTMIFGIALIAAFVLGYASERTLSIHSIDTTGREGFY